MDKNLFSRKLSEVIEDKEFEAWIRSRHGVFKFPIYINADYMQEPVEAMDLSVRASNSLRRAGYTTVHSLVDAIDRTEDLTKIRNCGIKTRNEIMLMIFLYQYSKLSSKGKEEYQNKIVALNTSIK